VRVALQVVAILEGARLALVCIHGQQTGAGFGTYEAPFLPRREARTAKTTQARVRHRGNNVFHRTRAREAVAQQRVTAFLHISIAAHVVGNVGIVIAALYGRGD
jgi:hypothetical protein